MTARTTTLRGADAGRYYVEDQIGYYLDNAEPPGVWHGQAAQRLGLEGNVDEVEFLDVLAGVDPATGALLGSRHSESTVRGFDVTCSAPKSASVLFAVGDGAIRHQVLEAHDAAVGAVVDWIELQAHCRYRVDGEVCVFDAEGIAAAVFRQHTSRALDPQLRSHVVIANRVPSPDGRWLALDARTIKCDQQALSRLYHAGLRSELTRRLGVAWNDPVNGIAEMADVPAQVLAQYCRRTDAVDARVEEKLERFVESFERAPTPRERWRLEREAVLDSRPPKLDADPAALEADWRDRLVELAIEPERLVADVIGVERGIEYLEANDSERLVERALAALAERQSTWRAAEVIRELAAAAPTTLAIPAASLGTWIDDLATHVVDSRMVDLSRPVPDGVALRRDGRPISEAAPERILTLPSVLAQEQRLVALAERRIALGGADGVVEAVPELSGAQHDLAAATTGERELVLAVGPAGTGKTTALRPAVEQLRSQGRPVFGVAPSAGAAEVLATDAGMDTDTLDKLLVEHRLGRPPDHPYDLAPGTTVICDEAAMVPTPRLAELFELADRRGWRLGLIGDPMQFSAVGRSGMFGYLVDAFGAIELDRVHRFNHEWEREASLRLRRGDTSVIDLYDAHGRIHGGTPAQMRGAAVAGWGDAIQRGETASMMAPTNAAVTALNVDGERCRIDAGEIDTAHSIDAGAYRLHVGDVVATRHNDRHLLTDRNLMVKNRDQWRVEAVHRDGGLSVAGSTGRVRLPHAYVADHVELAYAQTSHANQGRTVERSFLYLDGPTAASGIYVPMTRGRESNEVFVATRGDRTPADVVAEALGRSWIDRPAIEVRFGLRHPPGDRVPDPSPLAPAELRRLLERQAELQGRLDLAKSQLDLARRYADRVVYERVTLNQSIADHEQRLAAANQTVADFDRPLVRRRHRVELEGAHRQLAWVPRALAEATAKLAGLGEERTTGERLQAVEALERDVSALEAECAGVRGDLSRDARVRGQRLGVDEALLVDRHLGPKPPGAAAADLWVDATGRALQLHAAFDLDDTTLLGPAPDRFADDAFALTRRSTSQAVERLDRTLGRQPELARADVGISLSL